jgi:hypothetical protein
MEKQSSSRCVIGLRSDHVTGAELLCVVCCNIKRLRILPTQCIYVFVWFSLGDMTLHCTRVRASVAAVVQPVLLNHSAVTDSALHEH